MHSIFGSDAHVLIKKAAPEMEAADESTNSYDYFL